MRLSSKIVIPSQREGPVLAMSAISAGTRDQSDAKQHHKTEDGSNESQIGVRVAQRGDVALWINQSCCEHALAAGIAMRYASLGSTRHGYA
jgi:hypothetical protein